MRSQHQTWDLGRVTQLVFFTVCTTVERSEEKPPRTGVLNSLQEVLKCEQKYLFPARFVWIDRARLPWLCILPLPLL